MDYGEFFSTATGNPPYAYQRGFAEDGLPSVWRGHTGTGKTEAVVLAWLWRRLAHPDPAVRAATPRWVVYTLPMRTLVNQTHDRIQAWLANLAGLVEPVGLYRVMGGERADREEWSRQPEAPAIFVGTVDMLLSRALNRGYAESRWTWPISFGLFNNGCHWVFDEVQLMEVATQTSRQLDGLRASLGTVGATTSTWMSATLDRQRLETVDAAPLTISALPPHNHPPALQQRLDATKTVRQLTLGDSYQRSIASEAASRHTTGTLSIVIVNTVERAQDIYAELAKLKLDADVVLLHSRFRAQDRQHHVEQALAPLPPAGRIVVATQVLEAGIDLDAQLLITEVAPWASLVQRAGRCNRSGARADAELWWAQPPKEAPYEPEVLAEAQSILESIEGQVVSPAVMSTLGADPPIRPLPVLRRRDLLGLFDTTPDLSGNDLDVARFIREPSGREVMVAWRYLDGTPGDSTNFPPLTANELCPVPLERLREKLSGAVRFDHLKGQGRGDWVPVAPSELRDGMTVCLDAAKGGYDTHLGWQPKSTSPVPPILLGDEQLDDEEGYAEDPWSGGNVLVELAQHLDDTRRRAEALCDALPGLAYTTRDAVVAAARLHDIGKAHPVFQDAIHKAAEGAVPRERLLAKSGTTRALRYEERYFRHELASAIALMGEGNVAVRDLHEPDLAIYLVAAHHGRVRLTIRRMPDELPMTDGESERALGVRHGTLLPDLRFLDGGHLDSIELDLAGALRGSPDGALSYGERMLVLRDRADLGPFRLAFLEAIVRLADWQASSAPGAAL
jgi:CRISPR-associated endonuclease/helicase Cas3